MSLNNLLGVPSLIGPIAPSISPPIAPSISPPISPPIAPPIISTKSDKYSFCSNENDTCKPGIGTYSVAFSSTNGNTYFRNITSDSIRCNTETFGDPDPGTKKECWALKLPDITFDNNKPSGFNLCATEGSVCTVKNAHNADIMYGANGKFVYANSTQVGCNSQVFGDPISCEKKACYYRTGLAPNPPVSAPPSVSKKKLNTWEIILIAIASLIVLILVGLGLWYSFH